MAEKGTNHMEFDEYESPPKSESIEHVQKPSNLKRWLRAFMIVTASVVAGCSPNESHITEPAPIEEKEVQKGPKFFNVGLTADQNNELVASLFFLKKHPRGEWPVKFKFIITAYDKNGQVIGSSLNAEVPVDLSGNYLQEKKTGVKIPDNTASYGGQLIAEGRDGEVVTKEIPRLTAVKPGD